jgi:formylglycine-generating enzyme required for sulfatase activity
MEVGSFAGNGWGLYEMHGNVWEWCEDWYAEKYPSGEVKDPVNTTTASNRVHRGGELVQTMRGTVVLRLAAGSPPATATRILVFVFRGLALDSFGFLPLEAPA